MVEPNTSPSGLLQNLFVWKRPLHASQTILFTCVYATRVVLAVLVYLPSVSTWASKHFSISLHMSLHVNGVAFIVLLICSWTWNKSLWRSELARKLIIMTAVKLSKVIVSIFHACSISILDFVQIFKKF